MTDDDEDDVDDSLLSFATVVESGDEDASRWRGVSVMHCICACVVMG